MANGIPGIDVRYLDESRYSGDIRGARNPRVSGGVSPQGAAWQAQRAGNVAYQAATDARAAARLGGVAAAPVAPVAPAAPQSLASRAMGAAGRFVNPDVGALVKGTAKLTAKSAPALGVVMGGAESAQDFSNGYADRFQRDTDLPDGVSGAFRTLTNIGNAATFGLAERLGRGLSNMDGLSGAAARSAFMDGITQDNSRDQYLKETGQSSGPLGLGSRAVVPPTAPAAAGAAPAAAQTPAPNIAAPAGPAPAVPPTPNPGANPQGVIIKDGNSYSGSNIGPGATMMVRGPNGGLTEAALGGNTNFIGGAPGGGTAAALREAQIYRDMRGADEPVQPRAPVVRTADNDWTMRNNLRNAAIDATSLSHQSAWANPGSGKAAMERYNALVGENARGAGRQAELEQKNNDTFMTTQAHRAGTKAQADATRYSSDNSLRGVLASAAATDRQTAATSLRETLRADRELRKQESDDAIRQNTLDQGNYDAVRKQHMQYTRDPKTGAMVEDAASTDRLIRAMDKVIPGYTTMSAAARAKQSGKAEALMSLYNRTKGGDKNGVFEALFGNDGPQRDSLPDFSGGELRQEGLTGALPGGAGVQGYYWRQPNGQELQLGKDLTENEINLLTEMGKKKKG